MNLLTLNVQGQRAGSGAKQSRVERGCGLNTVLSGYVHQTSCCQPGDLWDVIGGGQVWLYPGVRRVEGLTSLSSSLSHKYTHLHAHTHTRSHISLPDNLVFRGRLRRLGGMCRTGTES